MARVEPGVTLVRFYQWAQGPMERLLFGLLSRIVAKNIKACVVVADQNHAARLDEALWTQGNDSFLPHGICGGADSVWHPILLCTEPQDINGATVLLLAHGRFEERFGDFDMVLDFVPGHIAEGVQASRERYRRYRDSGCRMEYWIHSPETGWTLQSRHPKTNEETSP
ncbi:MAG: DNA polymerase III subunit chi [Magnetococcales bacterium]|nr:DNA polymerase III subunit chi [Magnetococcales bacterium]